mmetsp:Transcript_20458/g.37142  ORF Transcript_20458/g.37142 Transcript_20458/m.37142 type:complete len:367 (+) Transcript_20458:130-1230(+)|eukprot:CAMPEP_0202491634 /NCGR_PEP_ID=MMETSP1361-20130828/8628_1 /ASSEMBLY_ACC=CAM_ASM_000849 /TAXON_ID=210615 /ORGANISM="Staurosira complex sp., Strain CCMP2646" /LENGTH=366 /DNA_ID=CAMNT_0049121719 /DNA_START=94 /DNA_END=1194 /DNA_ORIENTATION=+
MGKDYYHVLGVPRDADEVTLKKAYRKGAVKWHPDKWSSKSDEEKKQAEEKFKEISEAYEVLTDPEQKAVYDRYGEEGLKAGGVPPEPEGDTPYNFNFGGSAGGGGGGFSGFNYGEGGGGTHSHGCSFQPGAGFTYQGNPKETFADFFSKSYKRQKSYGESPFEGTGGLEEMLFGGGGGRHGGPSYRSASPVRTCNVPCSLEELYNGKTKKMKITRKSKTPGRPTEKILELPIRPGFKAGTRITFSGEGDEIEPGVAEDIVFVIREKTHDRFVREGDDLHYRIKLNIADALCGFSRDIVMLDTKPRIKRLNQKTPVSNITTKVIAGEGMPISKQPGKKGDLIVTYDVEFPKEELTDDQKEKIRAAFP